MILSISNIAWAPEERRAAYAAMAEARVTGLEIAPGLFFWEAEDAFQPDRASAERALDEIAAEGLSLVSMQSLLFGVEGAALFGAREDRARFETGMTRAIDLAGQFGIPNLVFGSPKQRIRPEDMTEAEAIDQGADVFRRLGDKAAAAGTVITMESNPVAYGTNFLNRLDEALGFVAHADHPHIKLILDLGAMHMNDEFDGLAGRIPDLAPHLHHVHVSEPNLAPAPADPDALAPVLGALAASGYTGAVSIEMKRPETGLVGVTNSLAALNTAQSHG